MGSKLWQPFAQTPATYNPFSFWGKSSTTWCMCDIRTLTRSSSKLSGSRGISATCGILVWHTLHSYMDIFGYTAWQAPWSRSRSQLQGSFEANIWRFGMAEAESRALLDPRESKSVTTEGGRNGTWLCKVYELVTASKHSERHVLYGLVKKWTYCKKCRVWQEIRSSSSVTGSWIDAASKRQQDKWGKVMPPCRGVLVSLWWTPNITIVK